MSPKRLTSSWLPVACGLTEFRREVTGAHPTAIHGVSSPSVYRRGTLRSIPTGASVSR